MKNLHAEFMIQCEPTPVDWVVEGIAARGSVSVLYGEPGIGKSYLALAFAGALASGSKVAGIPCKQSGAILVDAENSEEELTRRMLGLGSFNGQCGSFFQVYSPEPGTSIDNPGNLGAIGNAIVDQHASLVVLDSLSALWPYGDENDRVAVTALFTELNMIARHYNAAVLVLHHTNREGQFRGSGAMKAMSDVFIEMGRWRKDLQPNRRYLQWKKCRVGSEPERQWFRMNPIFGGIELEHASRPTKSEMSWDD